MARARDLAKRRHAPSFGLRRWLVPDIPTIAALCRGLERDWNESIVAEFLSDNDSFGLVCTAQDLVIGAVIGTLSGPVAEVATIAVSKSWRRLGVGSLLMEPMIRLVKVSAVTGLAVCGERNLGGQLFFKHLGGRMIRTYRRLYDPDDAYLFEFVAAEGSGVRGQGSEAGESA